MRPANVENEARFAKSGLYQGSDFDQNSRFSVYIKQANTLDMKKHAIALLLSLYAIVGLSYAGTPAFIPNSLDIVNEGNVAYPLQSMLISMKSELAKHCPASQKRFTHFDGNAKTANAICQSCFLRPAGKQRWEMEDAYASMRKQLMPYFSTLRMTQTIYPDRTEYDVICINGSTVPVMRMYLTFLETLWTEFGVRAPKIILLTGKRKLDPIRDSEALMFDDTTAGVTFRSDWKRTEKMPEYESEAFRMLWDQMILNDALHNTEVVLIDAPEKWNEKTQSYTRPTTIDTVKAWLKTNPEPGKILSVSGNPFVQYQDATFRIELEKSGFMEEGTTLETVGPARPSITSTAIYLDTIARWLYTVYTYQSNK